MDIRNIAVQTEGVVELLDVDNNPLLDDSGEPLKVTVFGPGAGVLSVTAICHVVRGALSLVNVTDSVLSAPAWS